MKMWLFANRGKKPSAIYTKEPTALERLLTLNCDREQFMLLFVKMLQQSMPQDRFEMVDAETVRKIDRSRKESTIFLANAWISYSRNPDAREELLQRHLAAAISMSSGDEPLDRNRVVPIVKDLRYLEYFKPEDDAAVEHLCADLWVVYAQDFPDRVKSLKWTDLEAASVSRQEIRDLALNNLRRILPPIERHGEGPWYMLTAGSDYTASLLLFDRIWDDMPVHVEGQIAAVAPSRDVILFTGSESKEGIAEIRCRAAEIQRTGNYLISETLLVRSKEQWSIFNAS